MVRANLDRGAHLRGGYGAGWGLRIGYVLSPIFHELDMRVRIDLYIGWNSNLEG